MDRTTVLYLVSDAFGLFASNFLFVSGIINELKAGWQWGGFTANAMSQGSHA